MSCRRLYCAVAIAVVVFLFPLNVEAGVTFEFTYFDSPESGFNAGALGDARKASLELVADHRTGRDGTNRHSPGDPLNLQVRRGGETLDIAALLKSRRPWRLPTREEFQNQLGSLLSQRRQGFPSAFQHNTVIKPSDCGGPVVNLDGKVVGFNLARAGRTETYAIPADVVVGLIKEMKRGLASER